VLSLALVTTTAEATQRAFVSSFGSDANTALNCTFANPCRGFTAAMTVVDPGGEVLALDSVGYGAVTITKSVTISAAPGAYAGITVPTGQTGVTIATPGIRVTLRGLVINGTGGNNGVAMTGAGKLAIENCVIANFTVASGNGVLVNADAKVRITDTIIRDNDTGVLLQGGANAAISGSKILGNATAGLKVFSQTGGVLTNAVVSDTLVSGNAIGVWAHEEDGTSLSRIMVNRSAVTSSTTAGIFSEFAGGPTLIGVSYSLVTSNSTGLSQSGVGAELDTFGNNTIRYNGPNVGTITSVPMQ
jgi:hypothetical protein